VGIDLGTTNSAVAYVDTSAGQWQVRDFPIPQLVAPGEVEARPVLPSFHYEPAANELPTDATRLPWSPAGEPYAVGIFARDHGAVVPGRLVVSAKSWLSHGGVDRTAALLPWHGAQDVTKLSPVEVSRRFLSHIRAVWDHAHPDSPLAEQDVILTVPASFDEVARELTVDAARGAGIARVTLLEEPQAAFYAWINAQGDAWATRVCAGQKILVCDVGGGTSDFTLIRVRPATGGATEKVLFHRVAVGEHLILGGDNLDLALAHHIERRLKGPDGKLDPRQWGPLVRTCRALKETLLGPDAPQRLTVSVAGGGAKLVGGATQLQITRDEVLDLLLEGFLPRVHLTDRPAARRSGFQEFGLPYAPDPAITKYLAAFLTAHRLAGDDPLTPSSPHPLSSSSSDPARPDIVLFNGGLFESPVLRERLVEVLSAWFSGRDAWQPEILENDRLDLAVARGAAYYGMVRRGKGVRISGGLARTYYIGVETKDDATGTNVLKALTLLPAGAEEGHDVQLPGRTFDLLIRQPVEFPLFVSSTRTTDAPGTLLDIDPEQMRELPLIRTVLQSGRKTEAASVRVALHARLTEIGTLEMWAAEVAGERRWRLQFDVRGTQRSDFAAHESRAEAEGVIDQAVVDQCARLIRASFVRGSTDRPEGLVKRLEQATGMTRLEWPSSLMRSFWEVLIEVEPGRRLSDQHEARWLNLVGFCLRPGYGLAVDDWRVAQTWRLYPQRVAHAKNELVRAEWWILWRRLAGGLSAGQQQTLAQPLLGAFRDRIRMPGSGGRNREPAYQFGPHETAEVWRTLGAMELLALETKAELAKMLLDLLSRERPAALHDAALWALGRIGARVPLYGPLNALVPAQDVQAWLTTLTSLKHDGPAALFAAVQMARRTRDRYRDVSEPTREKVLEWLIGHDAPPHFITLVREGGQLEAEEQKSAFGESLPRGLRIE
ncbi:MAG TPA: Hsp70 family protein, partial [Tepidisphaeraceae bacterium]